MKVATILVEDNARIRETLIAALTEVTNVSIIATAETAQDAAVAFANHKDEWRLAVVDLFLREGSGLAVVDGLKGRSPEQRVVVLSNYATADMRRRCKEMGADAVFDKSTQLDEFFDYCTDKFT